MGIPKSRLAKQAQEGRHPVRRDLAVGRYLLYYVTDEEHERVRGKLEERERAGIQPEAEPEAAAAWEELASLTDDEDTSEQTDPGFASRRRPTERPAVHTAVVVSDVHVPDHDAPAWSAVLDFVRETQPAEVVIAGDFLELESASQHGGVANPRALVDEIRAGRRELQRLREAVPSATITYLEGNHETRLSRITVRHIPTFSGAFTVPDLLGLRDFGIRWLPHGKAYALGKLRVMHGWYTPKHHAAKHLDALGHSVMYGHTHRPQTFTRSTAENEQHAAYGLGCLRTLDADWCDGKPMGWHHGFGVVDVLPSGQFHASLVSIHGGRFAFGGRVYG